MTENQTRDCPVAYLFRTWQDTLGEQILKASSSEFITFSTCHAMFRIVTFISFVTGEYIQISTIQPDSVFFDLGKIALHIIRCLCCTQIRLWTPRPSLVLRNASIR